MPFIVKGDKSYKPSQGVSKPPSPKQSAPTKPGAYPMPKKGRPKPIINKPGD